MSYVHVTVSILTYETDKQMVNIGRGRYSPHSLIFSLGYFYSGSWRGRSLSQDALGGSKGK